MSFSIKYFLLLYLYEQFPNYECNSMPLEPIRQYLQLFLHLTYHVFITKIFTIKFNRTVTSLKRLM